MSDCLLRISEAVAVNVGDIQKSTLRIKSSKTDQEGRGEVLYVGGPTLKLIDRYCTKAEIQSGALFRHIRRGDHVQSGRLYDGFGSADHPSPCQSCRCRRIHLWSFAQGRQCCLARTSGASVVDMQNAGRWKSPQMPAHYAKAELAERGAVARFFYGKGRGIEMAGKDL